MSERLGLFHVFTQTLPNVERNYRAVKIGITTDIYSN